MVLKWSLVRLHWHSLILCSYTISPVANMCSPIILILELRLSSARIHISPLFVQPASQHCRSILVYPTSWSQPKSDLPLVIQLLYPAGLHSLGLLVGGTEEDGSAAWSKITVILHRNSTELKIKPIRKTRGSCYVISSCFRFFFFSST